MGHADLAPDRGYVDDSSKLAALPLGWRCHRREVGPPEMGVDRIAIIIDGHGLNWTDTDRPCVIDQNVHGTEVLLDLLDCIFSLLAQRHIGFNGEHVESAGPSPLCRPSQLI